jgi:hypothetical protein
MPKYLSIDVRCTDCETVWNELATDEELEKNEWTCDNCGGIGSRTMSAPTVLQASYPDGTKRKGFEDLKKAAKLETQMYNLPPNKRGEIKKEIHERRKIK